MSAKQPGGSGAVLGTKVLRYSGIQGSLLLTSNVLAFASVIVVAFFLGPAEFGRFGLLLFLSGLLNVLFNLATKQGTFKRVFGMSDDDDDEEEASDAAAEIGGDRRSLGTGLWMTTGVSVAGTLVVVALAGPIAGLLLGDEGDRNLVVLAAVAGGLGAVFRLSSLVLWLERRPGAHVAAEVIKPLLILAAVVALLASGSGLEGAVAGTVIGSALAVVVALLLLRGSYDPRPTLVEAGHILRRGAPRIPVVLSMWTLMNADIFILSRFVTDADLGIYQLASRTGIVVALLPGGFRIAMRPLRKSLTFKAVQDEYGRATARGQQLTYFLLLCIVALLGVVLATEALAHAAPSGYADAAPLVPLLALALMGTSILRSVAQAVSIRNKRITFIFSAVSAALIFVGSAIVLVPQIGLEGAPLGMIIGFTVPSLYMLVRSQLGKEPIRVSWGKLAGAVALAALAAGAYDLAAPERGYLQLSLALGIFAAYVALLPALGILPRHHWGALFQILRALTGRKAGGFDPRRALAGLDDADRVALRLAIVKGRPVHEVPERLANRGLESDGATNGGERVVAALRRAAAEGGVELDGAGGEDDAGIAEYLFPEGTVARRDASMRRLLSEGVASDELMALEHVLDELAGAKPGIWKQARSG